MGIFKPDCERRVWRCCAGCNGQTALLDVRMRNMWHGGNESLYGYRCHIYRDWWASWSSVRDWCFQLLFFTVPSSNFSWTPHHNLLQAIISKWITFLSQRSQSILYSRNLVELSGAYPLYSWRQLWLLPKTSEALLYQDIKLLDLMLDVGLSKDFHRL